MPKEGRNQGNTSTTIPVNTKIYTFTWFVPSRA